MRCPRCQQDNPSQAKFCLQCGDPVATLETHPAGHPDPKQEIERLNRSLNEAFDQQAATSEILRVITRSPGQFEPVFDEIARHSALLCHANRGSVNVLEGDWIRFVGRYNGVDRWTRIHASDAPNGVRVIRDGLILHVTDVETDARMTPEALTGMRDIGARAFLTIPMQRGTSFIGSITVYRNTPGAFSDRQIDLLKTFADLAVIAVENVRLFNDTKEALEQQTATSEVLRVIAGSPTDVQPVFATIMENALRLCSAQTAAVLTFDGHMIHAGAFLNIPANAEQQMRRLFPRVPDRSSAAGRAILTGDVAEIPDVEADPDYAFTSAVRAGGFRANTAVPMLRDGRAVGTINLARTVAGRFYGSEIALLKTFADQAVIAIENVRLFTELQEKNTALTTANAQVTEALDQQTATSDILRAISASPVDVQPVFETIARNSVRLCNGVMGAVFRFDGEFMHIGALHGFSADGAEATRRAFPARPEPRMLAARAVLSRAIVHVPDVLADPDFDYRALAATADWRSLLVVPMLGGGEVLGTVGVARAEIGPFRDQEIALLKTFADQAVIAIENVRLFTELETRNRDLTEALDRQTATAEILRVISQSQTEVQPVFDAIVDNAMRLFRAWAAAIVQLDGQLLHLIAVRGGRPGLDQYLREQSPWSIDGAAPVARSIVQRTVIHVPDTELDRFEDEAIREIRRRGGMRSVLAAPMLRNGQPIGGIWVARAEAGSFSPTQIALLQTFADQAVIAIENTRLLNELQARTQELTRSVEQLTALGEVGQAISSTLDIETVLTTIVSRAVQLSGLDGGVVFEYDTVAEEFAQRASTGQEALAPARRRTRIPKGEGVVGRTAVTHEPVQVPDITREGAYESRLRESLVESGVRALLAVPMLREGHLIGSLVVARNTPGEFAADTIDLLRTFATQSALAIQNARLFQEIADKSRQLEVASQHKSEFLANMSHELRTPLNAVIGFSEVLGERMFGELNEKQDEYLKDIHASGQHLLSLINDILDLSKIEAGRMELELTDFNLPATLDNALTLVRERAGRRGIALGLTVDERLEQIHADERKVRQVVLNLLSNAIKFTPEGGRIEVRAVPVDGMVEISVSDTGVGIAREDQEAIFEEFRQVGTAAKKVEGTGLGLTLCRKFVELHGGRIWVKSELGTGSTFTFTIPGRRGE